MSDWSPIVYKLGKIAALPNSDFLEITTIMGEFPCIIRKGQYTEGQLISWLPYDTVCPDSEFFHSICAPKPKLDKDGNVVKPTPPVGSVDLKYRIIKAKKIRGIYSEGLIVDAPLGFNEGDSVVDHFGLTKRIYEEELPDLPDNAAGSNESAPKSFSLFKYDLEGLAKYGYVFHENEEVIIFEKLEGENCSITYLEDRLWVRSRNWFKKNVEGSHWWEIPNQMDFENKLKNYPGLAFWGELYGNVKHFSYDCPIVNNKIQRKFRVFDIWEIKHNRFLEWNKVEEICKDIELETAPVLYKGPWKTDRSLNELAEGASLIGKNLKEGFVMRSVPENWHEKLGRKIVKLKGKDYKIFKN